MGPTLHSATRLRERYGIDLSWSDLKALADRCAHGEGLVETQVDGSQLHALILGERILWLVFHPHTGSIVTALPPKPREAACCADYLFIQRRKQKR